MWKARVNCHNCSKKGQTAWECPEGKGADKEERLHANIEEQGSNEDNIDQGKNIFVQKEGGCQQELAPLRQSEHGQSDC